MVTVFIDGFFDEPASVARMFGVRVYEHEGVSVKNSRICQVRGYSKNNLVPMAFFLAWDRGYPINTKRIMKVISVPTREDKIGEL